MSRVFVNTAKQLEKYKKEDGELEQGHNSSNVKTE
jgi:hypothetical protein